MIPVDWPMVIGIVAALLTTLAFLPQLFKIKKAEGAELSSAMLAMYLTGQVLWLAYGLMVRSVPVILANGTSMVLVSAVTARKMAAARDATADTGPTSPGRGSARRLRIAIDMDEVMADALPEQVRRYNAAFGSSISVDDLHGRHLEDAVPSAHRDAIEAMYDASFFAGLAVMPDCQDVVRELADRHEVLVVSAAMDVPASFDAKFRWLRQHFPFIPPDQIVFCGDKGVIDADYLIDDRARHFTRFKGRPLLFSAPHNAHEKRYPRVDSWKDVGEVLSRATA